MPLHGKRSIRIDPKKDKKEDWKEPPFLSKGRYSREMPGTCEKDKKPVNGTEISIEKVCNGKAGLTFSGVPFLSKNVEWITSKSRVPLHLDRNFRKFVVNGKQQRKFVPKKWPKADQM